MFEQLSRKPCKTHTGIPVIQIYKKSVVLQWSSVIKSTQTVRSSCCLDHIFSVPSISMYCIWI